MGVGEEVGGIGDEEVDEGRQGDEVEGLFHVHAE
jgi:hypothetical protein